MAQTKQIKSEMTDEQYWNERVPVYIPRPETEKGTSRTVTVNGRNYQIAYDTQVLVPRFVAQVVQESLRNARRAQDRAAAALSAAEVF